MRGIVVVGRRVSVSVSVWAEGLAATTSMMLRVSQSTEESGMGVTRFLDVSIAPVIFAHGFGFIEQRMPCMTEWVVRKVFSQFVSAATRSTPKGMAEPQLMISRSFPDLFKGEAVVFDMRRGLEWADDMLLFLHGVCSDLGFQRVSPARVLVASTDGSVHGCMSEESCKKFDELRLNRGAPALFKEALHNFFLSLRPRGGSAVTAQAHLTGGTRHRQKGSRLQAFQKLIQSIEDKICPPPQSSPAAAHSPETRPKIKTFGTPAYLDDRRQQGLPKARAIPAPASRRIKHLHTTHSEEETFATPQSFSKRARARQPSLVIPFKVEIRSEDFFNRNYWPQ